MANPLCHFELMTSDLQKCRDFYGAVFDWQFDEKTMPGYTLINTGTDPPGGIMKKPEKLPGVCINTYFNVGDIDTVLKKAVEHGGKILVEKTPVPNVGHLAMFADPEGIVIGIMQGAS
ncbi:MAG: VOC family protein [Planctomycetes bacterium]|nr:VOC family protein [Planctomycetota bacterium]